MDMINAVLIVNSLLLGLGLAMDAFSVSLANGLNEPHMKKRRMCLIALVYALFQYAMPVIGWLCVHTIEGVFSQFQRFIPWIALALLLYIGGKMLIEGLRDRKRPDENTEHKKLGFGALMVQGVATSIDALSVGFTISEYGAIAANVSALIIGVVTFAVCMVGLFLGRKAGTRLSWKASVLGGVILIAIGVEIFVKGVFFS